MTEHGKFHWNELMTRDVEKAKAFYGMTLGWTFEEMPMPMGFTYTLAKSGDQMAGGMMPMSGDNFKDVPEQWISYIATDNVDECVAKVETAGGKIIAPPFDIAGVGRIAMVEDANGATIGWMTPEEGQ